MRGRNLSYLLAALLWVTCAYELGLTALRAYQGTLGDTPIVGRLLTQGDAADKVAPTLVLAVFGWVLLDILFHAQLVRREQQAVEQLQTWSEETFKKPFPGLRAGNRVRLVEQNLRVSPGALHETLPAAAALDATALDNNYTLTRAYVWILPVIGFIGTAWGMAHAIAGFKDALGAKNIDVVLLTDRLSQLVIPSLANAFSITMLALGASIVGHFCATSVQSWDVQVLNDLDRACVSLLTRFPQTSRGESHGANVSQEDAQTLFQLLDQISTQLGELGKRLDLVGAASKLNEAASEIGQAAQALKDSATLPYNITITRGKNS